MAYFLGSMLVLGSENLCKSAKECDDIVIFDGEKRDVGKLFSISPFGRNAWNKTSRHNAPWTMQSPETKRILQSHYPPGGGQNPLSSHQKKINMYIVGCFVSHFAIDSN